MKRSIDAICILAVVISGLALGSLALADDASKQPAATHAAPNIVIILLDDIGFGNASTFGGIAQTPELDRFAAQGLRYNNFNTTAICSATRAALLTGLNHHRVGFGTLADTPGQLAGYNTIWKKNAPSIAQVLAGNGYSTAAIGKWHNTPWKEITPTGPFDRWPTGLGFDYFYGFMEPGAQSQWEPASLYRNTTPVEPPATPAQGYHLTTDCIDEAIRWIGTHESLAPEKPYFLYFATGAVHFPHHVPKEWIEKYRGQFDQGWDAMREQVFARQKQLGIVPANAELTRRPADFPAWDSLSTDQKKLSARQMEVYAGFIAHTDHEVGRLIQAVGQGPRGDNTAIFYILGDNGGSPGMDAVGDVQHQLSQLDELGGALLNNGIEAAWGWASSTPFQWIKGVASHFGGVRNPLVVSWPARIKEGGELREQFLHINDIAPTIYSAAGIEYPATTAGLKTLPLDGVSFAATFERRDAPADHRTQYFEMFGNRAIYEDGWVAAARHTSPDFNRDAWELYHVAEDFSEAHNVAAEHPEKLKALQSLFDAEAKRNDVYPLLASRPAYKAVQAANPMVYHAGFPRMLGVAAPDFLRSHRISADVKLPDEQAEGVILAFGGRWGGFVLYVKDDHLIYENNLAGEHLDVIRSANPLPTGKVALAYEFTQGDKNGAAPRVGAVGVGRLFVNGQPAGEAKIELDSHAAFWGCFGIGQAFGSPITSSYAMPYKFSGTLDQVSVELK